MLNRQAKADLEYRTEGMFTSFISNTKEGEHIWKEIAARNEGVGKISTFNLDSTLRQIRAAGYVVRKAKKVVLSDEAGDALLAEVEAVNEK